MSVREPNASSANAKLNAMQVSLMAQLLLRRWWSRRGTCYPAAALYSLGSVLYNSMVCTTQNCKKQKHSTDLICNKSSSYSQIWLKFGENNFLSLFPHIIIKFVRHGLYLICVYDRLYLYDVLEVSTLVWSIPRQSAETWLRHCIGRRAGSALESLGWPLPTTPTTTMLLSCTFHFA